MRLTFVQPPTFVRNWNKLGLNDDDLRALETLIMERPEAGDVMRGTGGVLKIRFAPPSWHRGKSGATRVCYVCFGAVNTVYLLAIFAKKDQANLTSDQKATFKTLVKQLEAELGE